MAKKKKKPAAKKGAPKRKKGQRDYVPDFPVSKLKVKKGFNPRETLGDLSDLTGQIKVGGVREPLECCPIDGGKAEVIDGHRRLAVARQLGLKTVPVMLCEDYADEATALAEAFMRNDGESRHNFTPVEAANAIARMKEMDKKLTQRAIAKKLGVTETRVSRALTMASLPDKVKNKIKVGAYPLAVGVALGELDRGVLDLVMPHVTEDTTAPEVKQLAKQLAKEKGKKSPLKNPRRARKPQDDTSERTKDKSSTPTGRTKAEMRDMTHTVIATIIDTEKKNAALPEDDQYDIETWHAALNGIFYCQGLVDEIDIEGTAYRRAFKSVRKDVEALLTGGEEEEEPPTKKKGKKKDKKKDKGKGKSKGKKGTKKTRKKAA